MLVCPGPVGVTRPSATVATPGLPEANVMFVEWGQADQGAVGEQAGDVKGRTPVARRIEVEAL